MSQSPIPTLSVLDEYRLSFTKMHGAGNDFIMVDNRDGAYIANHEQIAFLCDRHRGVGADGLIVMEEREDKEVPFRMRYFNSDGGEADMCGNGARCFAMFVHDEAGPFEHFKFETKAGVVSARIHGKNVTIGLSDPGALFLNNEIAVEGHELTVHSLNTGVPHAVVPVSDLPHFPVAKIGSALRHHSFFAPGGTNVNFVESDSLHRNHLHVRTFERGVEGETQACGTGVVASALVYAHEQALGSPVKVTVRGGETLEVAFRRKGDGFEDVTLTGPAEFVFKGSLLLRVPTSTGQTT